MTSLSRPAEGLDIPASVRLMSLIGTNRTSSDVRSSVAIRGKADMVFALPEF